VLPFHGLCGTPSSKRSLDHFDEDSLWPITEVLMPSGEFSTPKKAAKKKPAGLLHSWSLHTRWKDNWILNPTSAGSDEQKDEGRH